MAVKEILDDSTILEEVDTFTDIAPMEPGLEAILSTLTQADFVAQGGQAQIHRVTKGDVDVAARSVSFREDDDQIKRLQREARVLRGLEHPNIVGYRGYEVNPVKKRWGTDIEYTFYMDFVVGPTLRDIIEIGKDHRELSGDETDAIFAQVGSALSYCHDRSILHRDIKPSNVKLMEGDVVKVIDFGLVKKEGESTMTGSEGRFLGSYKYAAPEVREGKRAEAASDWYSAAVMTVEMALGKPYTKIVDPADVRQKLSAMSTLPPRLRESLELLLEEDVAVRTQNLERVKGLYGLGKGVEETAMAEVGEGVGLEERTNKKINLGRTMAMSTIGAFCGTPLYDSLTRVEGERDLISLGLFMVGGAVLGGGIDYIIQKYGSIKNGIQRLREKYDLYDLPPFLGKKGADSLVQQLKEEYHAWRKSRVLKKDAASLSSKLEKICENDISARQIRNIVLPALEHRDNNVKAAAVKALVKYDLDRREYRQLVEDALPSLYEAKNPYAKVDALLYLTGPNATAEEIEKYLPELRKVNKFAIFERATNSASPDLIGHVYGLFNGDKVGERPSGSLEEKVDLKEGEIGEEQEEKVIEDENYWRRAKRNATRWMTMSYINAGVNFPFMIYNLLGNGNVKIGILNGFATLAGAVGLYGSSKNRKEAVKKLKQLQSKSLEEHLAEDESGVPAVAEPTIETAVTTGLTPLKKAGRISKVKGEWDAKHFNHSFYALLGSMMTGGLGYVAVEVFRDYGTKPGMVLSAIAAIAGANVVRNIVGRINASHDLKLLDTDPDVALFLYEQEKREEEKGLVGRMTERYNSWREEKGREWVDGYSTDPHFQEKMRDYSKNGISSKGIKRRILPALHHWSNDVRQMALDVILNNDGERQEYRDEVKRIIPKITKYGGFHCRVLTYLSNTPSHADREEVITHYLLPAIDYPNPEIKKHAISLLTTLEPEAEVKYKDAIAAARESISEAEKSTTYEDDYADDPWHYVNPLKYPK